MARAGITQEQVLEAAQALLEEGITPTVAAVRERLGSGSYTTISAHLAEWRSQNTQAPANIPEMPERVRTALNQVWAQAAAAAQEGLETQRQALEAMRRELDKERADMGAEIERLERAQEQAQEQIEHLRASFTEAQTTNREAQAQLLELKVENARLGERASSAEGRGAELREQVQGLQQQLAELAGKQAQEKPTPHQGDTKPGDAT
jgi:chromosome segregation ATPase